MNEPADQNTDTDSISDGYHTFGELYTHRAALMVGLMSSNPHLAWYALRHPDGSMFPGFFLAGMNLPTGQISYHLQRDPWLAALRRVHTIFEREYAPDWDGHTADNVVTRITAWVGVRR